PRILLFHGEPLSLLFQGSEATKQMALLFPVQGRLSLNHTAPRVSVMLCRPSGLAMDPVFRGPGHPSPASQARGFALGRNLAERHLVSSMWTHKPTRSTSPTILRRR